MAYEAEEVLSSQEIFYYLLEHHELREEDEPLLYKAYTEEEAIRNLVKSQGEVAAANVERYGNVIYLIPKEENNFLGFSKQQLKNTLWNFLMGREAAVKPGNICGWESL